METPQLEHKNFTEKTPADLRADFRHMWRSSFRGGFPAPQEGQTIEDAEVDVEAYEVIFDPLNQQERKHNIQEFGLRAVAAGFEIAGTIITPGAGFRENGHQVHAITYLLKSPQE